MAIEFVVEDCVDADFNSSLTASRRNDILTTLKEKQEPLIQYTFTYISQCLSDMSAAGSASSSSCAMVNAALRMLCPISTLATPEEMCLERSDFSSLIPVLLSIPETQEQTAKFLNVVIYQRKLSVDLFLRLLAVLPSALIGAVGKLCCMSSM